jgi:hypothetical protein
MSLNADCFITLAGFCFSIKDLVRLWIATGCKLPSKGKLWTYALIEFLFANDEKAQKLENHQQLEDITIRLGCRLDSNGLLLIERMFTTRKCSRSGCFKLFKEIDNHSNACYYHKGALKRGKLTCCRQNNFKDIGCSINYHNGSLHEAVFQAREADFNDDDEKEIHDIDAQIQRNNRHRLSISEKGAGPGGGIGLAYK